MRLIDADAFKAKLAEEEITFPMLDFAPTVDVVPVIRCKDCKHCRRELAQGKWEGSCRYWNTHSVMLNDFCSYGERKEE